MSKAQFGGLIAGIVVLVLGTIATVAALVVLRKRSKTRKAKNAALGEAYERETAVIYEKRKAEMTEVGY